MTDDLAGMAAFAAARLAEDEATAGRAAACGKLVREGAERGLPPGDWSWLADYGQPQPGDIALIDHQVRFDPARVLRDVEATRKLLAEIQRMPHLYLDEDAFYSCALAVDPEPYGDDDTGPGSGCLDEDRRGKSCDCGRDPRARRLLAAIVMRWASHPDYLSSWAPEAVGG